MNTRSLTLLALAGLVCGTLTACLSQPFPDRRFYAIAAGTSSAPATAPAPREVSLRVAPVRIIPPYDAITFNYKIAANEFKTDYYNAFAAPPARLLTAELVSWLNSSGALQFAASADARVHTTYVLETTVTDLYGDYSVKSAPKAVLQARVLVIQDVGPGTRVVLNKTYAASEAVAGDGPDKLVAAWNVGWRKILDQITADAATLPLPAASRGN